MKYVFLLLSLILYICSFAQFLSYFVQHDSGRMALGLIFIIGAIISTFASILGFVFGDFS